MIVQLYIHIINTPDRDVSIHILPLYLSIKELPLPDAFRTLRRPNTLDPTRVIVLMHTNTPGVVVMPFVHIFVKIRDILFVLPFRIGACAYV